MYRAMCLLQIAQNNNCKHFRKWVSAARALPTVSESKKTDVWPFDKRPTKRTNPEQ